MLRILVIGCLGLLLGCSEKKIGPSYAQEIVDSSIAISGGDLYRTSRISFDFRNQRYVMERNGKQKVLMRIMETDTGIIRDMRYTKKFKRFVNDSLVVLSDSLSHILANAINSVHYFAYLPYGLNDPAVNKEYLGNATIAGQHYHKIRVTFDEEGGGDDHDDTFVYWFHTQTLKPEYLAYSFHVNGGGIRFRKAYNERYINGIRFVDYLNYEPLEKGKALERMDGLFETGGLRLLSRIAIDNIKVSPGSYN
ncbi:MAG: DUF6503 family protein [Bacteroidota bacterium]